MKNYQILLCENFYDGANNFDERTVCEIGSSAAHFSGKAYDVVFYTKIDGTHELSFKLPRYCFDENTGENIKNEIFDYITNKSKIILKDLDEKRGKEYHLVVNNRTDSEENGVISCSYFCTDAYIEELSKTGYGLSFTDEIEGNGLGTIHELASEILKDSGWKYSKAKTGTLLEYSTDIEYDAEQRRYNTVYIPQPVHPIKYIKELKRYCNQLDVLYVDKNGKTHNIYCYENTEQIINSSARNLLYNCEDFVDISSWTSFKKDEKGKTTPGLLLSTKRVDSSGDDANYYFSIAKSGNISDSFVLNDSAADSKTSISAKHPYLFKYEATSGSKGYISSIRIFDGNPLTKIWTDADEAAKYSQVKKFKSGTYYTIKTDVSLSKPYIVIGVHCEDGSLTIKNLSLFKVEGKGEDEKLAEENHLNLITNLLNEDNPSEAQLEKMHLPDDTALSAYTHKETVYFYLNSNDEPRYLDFETQINKDGNKYTNGDTFNKLSVEKVDALPEKPKLTSDQTYDKKIYYLKTNGKYYQYYELTAEDGKTGAAWDLALYGDGAKDKRRTLVAEKSNRFNLIQELAELFKVWPVFEIKRNSATNKVTKTVWFKEKAINQNFSGFHKGVNLQRLERKADSENIVTKIFVEDVESEFAENGFVTIRTAELNPWGENYYYNFKYYVEQRLLDGDIIDEDLKTLYKNVKSSNEKIFDLNDKLATTKVELNNLHSMITSISYCIASCNERIAYINADLKKDGLSKTDKKKLKTNKKNYNAQLKKYQNQSDKTENKYNELKKKQEAWEKRIETETDKKKESINNFEQKYRSYIKEGVWSDSTYADNNAYYLDSQKVANTSAMPNTSWTISVIDSGVIDELEEFKVAVGDQTILVDNEFFGIKPNVEENYVFEVLVTGLREYLDDCSKNEVEVKNYLTSFEDIFQRISAATQTLELNEQTYDKAAYFSADGTVDKDIFQNTLLNNSLVLANSADNSYTLDENGLSLQSLINPAKKMRAIADGIFFSNSTSIITGEPEWKTGITAEGINASVITSGEINTSLIKIYSDGQVNFSWGPEGITSYDPAYSGDEIDTDSFIRLDGFGLYSIRDKTGFQLYDNGTPWFTGLEREKAIEKIVENSVFSITDKGFRLNVLPDSGSGYIKIGYYNDDTTKPYGLYIADEDGAEAVKLQNNGKNIIGGWEITNKAFQHKDGNALKMFLSGTGEQIKTYSVGNSGSRSDWSIWTNGNFGVTNEGELYALGANINGNLSLETDSALLRFSLWKSLNGDNTYPLLEFQDKQVGNKDYRTGIVVDWNSTDKKYVYSINFIRPDNGSYTGLPCEFLNIALDDYKKPTKSRIHLSATRLTLVDSAGHLSVIRAALSNDEKYGYIKIDSIVRMDQALKVSGRIEADAGITITEGGVTSNGTKIPMITFKSDNEYDLFVNPSGRFQVDDGFDIYGGLTCSSLTSNSYVSTEGVRLRISDTQYYKLHADSKGELLLSGTTTRRAHVLSVNNNYEYNDTDAWFIAGTNGKLKVHYRDGLIFKVETLP